MKKVMLGLLVVVIIAVVMINQKKELDVYTLSTDVGDNGLETNLKKNLVEDLNELGIPGMQIAIATKEKQYNLSLGSIDYERRHVITNDHTLRMGSVTKVYTSSVMMKLLELGYIKLEDSLDNWFPEIKNAENIQIKHLLNHTSGVYNYTENLGFQLRTALSLKKIWEPEALYEYTLKGEAYFKPGEKHYYSNSNYVLLGLIAEQVTGKAYPQILNDMILEPLELKDTYFLPYDKTPSSLITGYDRNVIPFGVHEMAPHEDHWASSGYSAGAMASTTKDMVKFLKALFTYDIVSKETLGTMQTFGDFKDEDIKEQIGYGMGLRKLKIKDNILIGHTGTIPGFGAAMFYLPEREAYIGVLANVSYLDQMRVLRTIIDTLDDYEEA